MTQIVSKTTPTKTIESSKVDYRDGQLIGLEARIMHTDKFPEKYILSSRNMEPAFIRGPANVWTSRPTITLLMDDVLNDDRCEVFLFDNLKELGEWILK